MRLPNAERASIDPRKLTHYLLSLAHPRGRGKARFFQRFGFSIENNAELEKALRRHAMDNEILREFTTIHGTKYEIEGPMPTPSGRAPMLKTVWMIDAGGGNPRFVTAKPGRRRNI